MGNTMTLSEPTDHHKALCEKFKVVPSREGNSTVKWLLNEGRNNGAQYSATTMACFVNEAMRYLY